MFSSRSANAESRNSGGYGFGMVTIPSERHHQSTNPRPEYPGFRS